MKTKLLILLILLILVTAACSSQPVQPARSTAAPTPELPQGATRLLLSSDLHFQAEPTTSQSLVIPQMIYIHEITDALLDQAVGWGADGLLLCGDLTNDGTIADHTALAERLRKAEEQGLSVYVLPGNHDMTRVSAEEFAQIYADFGYSEAQSRDPASLSYSLLLPGGELLVALDTNVYGERQSSSEGMVSENTLPWLKGVLEEGVAQGRTIVTASHHTLLNYLSQRYGDAFLLDCPEDLSALMAGYGVSLHLSGHRHYQSISSQDIGGHELYEIISGMPVSYPNLFGELILTPGEIRYQTHTLDVEGWAAKVGSTQEDLLSFSRYSLACSRSQAEKTAQSALSTLTLSDWERREMLAFYLDFNLVSSSNALPEKQEELRRRRGYQLWQKYLGNTSWGKWMEYVLTSPLRDAQSLLLTLD